MNETGIIIAIAEVFFVLGGLVGFYAALKLYLRQKKCKKKTKPEGFDEIDISDDDNDYKFKVSDNGPGVDENIINKIFDPLFTTDSSRKISGLGLSICKEFVEMHNGQIEAHNDNGLIIDFTIPKTKRNTKK